ncbi:MAG: hypothetical protein GTN81_14405 [Proteobacteria bacterium]|nr:hypothetical protein [Pseudomonadota bacterium]
MGGNRGLPRILTDLSYEDLARIDVAMEGDWNATVVTVWSRERGLLGFSRVSRSHPTYKPSLELYFEDTWVGIHCFKRIDNQNVFDEELAIKVIASVEKASGVQHKGGGDT